MSSTIDSLAFFVGPALRQSFATGRVDYLPISYFAVYGYLRDRAAVALRLERKVSQLVVQDEAADHQLATESALHARRHADGTAIGIDDRKMTRRRQFADRARRKERRGNATRHSGFDGLKCVLRVDQRRTPRDIGRIEQGIGRHVDEIRIRHV